LLSFFRRISMVRRLNGRLPWLAACVAISSDRHPRRVWVAGAVLGGAGLVLMPRLDALLPIPSKPLEEFARHAWDSTPYGGDYSVWTSNSRIDLIRMPPGSAPLIFMRGRAHNTLDVQPEWSGILQDANAGTSIIEKFQLATSGERPSLYNERPDLPPEIDQWVAQALAVDPELRFHRVRGMWTALRAVLGIPRT
jgi:hypothetical protein